MLRYKTVFVIGAGASSEVGLPLGDELIGRIGDSLNFRLDRSTGEMLSGDATTLSCIRRYNAQNSEQPERLKLNRALQRVRAASAQAASIDHLLDAHREDEVVTFCGKVGIARAILLGERQSKLFYSHRDQSQIAFQTVRDTWYAKFFQILTENVSSGNVSSIFSDVAFISFNYDRTIEHYLVHALQNFYGISRANAEVLVSGLEIYHPYGVVGQLPWGGISNPVPFGGSDESDELLAASEQIRTFTERVEENTILQSMRSLVASADVLVFLGFAFHAPNMKLLEPDAQSVASRVFATAHGISDSNRGVIQRSIARLLGHAGGGANLEFSDGKCAELFDQFRRTLAE